ASLEYTTQIAQKAEAIINAQPEVAAVFSVAGFSFSGAAPNQGLMFARLKDFKDRPGKAHSLQAIVARLQGPLIGGIPGAFVIPVAPPPIQGLSAFGGFQVEVLDQSGGDITNLSNVTYGMIGKGTQTGKLVSLRTSFTANDPQLVVDIDR